MSRESLLVALALLASFQPSSAAAHNAVRQPSLGELVLKQEIVVRGTVRRATAVENGFRVAVLGVEKVLKGSVPEGEVRFVSDPDHGVRYAEGERVLLFLTRTTASAVQRRMTPYVSPQVFSMKYPITSFDPSGYDGLVGGLLAVEKTGDRAARLASLKRLLVRELGSYERRVRLYAAEALRAVASNRRNWNDDDRRQALAYVASDGSDPEVREALRPVLLP